MGKISWLDAAGAAMWELAEFYTGQVGYKMGTKGEGLNAEPRVIDCSGWCSLLLTAGMEAANRDLARELFSRAEIEALPTRSDRLVETLEKRTGYMLAGDAISVESLPLLATIGLQQGGGAWAANSPRFHGITHVVQILRRPGDDAPFASEAQGWSKPHGLRLMPLSDWLDVTRFYLVRDKAWAVDAFAVSAGAKN